METPSGPSINAPPAEAKPTPAADSFESQAAEQDVGLVREFADFLLTNTRWWLTPIVIVLLLVGALVVLSGTVAAPFIYTIF